MNPTGQESLSKDNYVKIDPLDPYRFLIQPEQMLSVTKFGTFGIHHFQKGAPLDKVHDAIEKYYEWYPVVSLTAEDTPSGIKRFKRGIVRESKVLEDVKNNKVIRSMDDYYDVMEKGYDYYYKESPYAFSQKIYKVDIPEGQISSPLLTSNHGYMMMVSTDHLLFDGKSHSTIRNFINGYVKDKNYKPDIEKPQEAVNSSGSRIKEDDVPRPMNIVNIEENDGIGREKNDKIPMNDRGLSLHVLKFPREALMRRKKYTATVAMTGVQSYIYNNLLLDYHNGKEYVGHIYGTPYKFRDSRLDPVPKGNRADLIGNDVFNSKSYWKQSRVHPLTLYQATDIAMEQNKAFRAQEYQFVVNRRFSPYLPPGFKPSSESSSCVLSNFGDIKMKEGIIDDSYAFGIGLYNVGDFYNILAGNPNNQVIMTTLSHKTSYPRRANELFESLFMKLLKISAKRDIGREELTSMPEYKELLRIALEYNK